MNRPNAKLRDPVWRLTGLRAEELQKDAGGQWPVAPGSPLYWIKDAKGKALRFAPNAAQLQIIWAIFVRKLRKILIPKARQLGMSTVIALIMLDMIVFGGGVQGALVDQTQADATKKLKGKIIFAFARLPRAMRRRYEVLKQNDHALSIKLAGRDDDTASEVQAGMNARGDTFQILHISEWGPIAFHDPPRSEEIITGAMPAAKLGIVVVETTWKGGKVGHLWDITKRALDMADGDRTAEDFTVFFFPWWGDRDYTTEGDGRQISAECRKYLDEAEGEIRKAEGGGRKNDERFAFTQGQRLWYYKVAWVLGLFRFQEYPSMLSECFRAPIEGAIYGELIDRLRARGGTSGVVADKEALVNTTWDLGSPLNTVTWYWQLVGEEIRFLDCDLDLDITPSERVTRMHAKAAAEGWTFGWHYLPHDAAAKKDQGRTVQAELAEAGLGNTRIVPRTEDVWIGINRVRQMFSRFTMRTPACDEALNRLEAYRVAVLIDRGRATDIPVHDKSSHCADGLRMMAEAELAGMVAEGWVKSAFDNAGLKALRERAKTGG